MTHDLAAQGLLAALRTAQLADDAAAVVGVHELTLERRAPAVAATVAVGGEQAETAPQKQALELFDVRRYARHV